MNILLIEPYFTGSHRAWAIGYAAHSRHEVRLVSHPGRWWKWRMRGSALTLARALDELDGWQPDLIVVSDMVDLAQFRSFARPFVGEVPTILYFHESQLTYPTAEGNEPDLSYALTNWLSACAADRVLFNSGYHLDVFFQALPLLLRNFPDLTHEHLIGEVAARSEVLPVGVDLSWIEERGARNDIARILWNHRWDQDKGPDSFAGGIERLVEARLDFELVLLGSRPPHPPPALTRIRAVAGDRIAHDGEAPLDLYRHLVSTCDVVASTALQEFFGVSVVEAVAAGCRPVLPDALSYPWLIPDSFHDAVLYEDGGLVEGLIQALADPVPPAGLSSSMARYSWDRLAGIYDERLSTIATRSDIAGPASG
jgi:glycosyltransferase involved in cell wall biosynthesis